MPTKFMMPIVAAGCFLGLSVSAYSQELGPEDHVTGNDAQQSVAGLADVETRSRPKLDEIIVTAQKVEESIHDVPISVTALMGDEIEKLGLNSPADIDDYMPNVYIDTNYRSMRGMGSTIFFPGAETSVSIFLDGVYQSTPWPTGVAFLDVHRVEVLRGPQGTLFGKSSVAGVINVVTREPTNEWGGSVIGLYGEQGQRTVKGAFGGPIIEDKVMFRLAYTNDNLDGYIENTAHGDAPDATERFNDKRQEMIRGKILFQDIGGMDILLTGQYLTGEILSSPGGEVIDGDPGLIDEFRQFDPDFDYSQDNRGSQDEPFTNDVEVIEATVRVTWGDEWAWKWLSTYQDAISGGRLDGDFTPSPIIKGDITGVSVEAISTEVMLNSPQLKGLFGLWDWGHSVFRVGGSYYYKEHEAPTLGYLDVALFASATAAGALDPLPPLGAILASLPPQIGVETFDKELIAAQHLYAVYGQLDWNIWEDFKLTVALRVGYEDRDGYGRQWDTSGRPNVVFPAIGFAPHEFDKTFTDSEFSPKLSAMYSVTENINVYGTYVEGHKSGGVNLGTFSGAEETLIYEPEETEGFEFGSKMYLLDKSVELNFAAFYTDYRNLQITILDGTNITVDNAAGAISQGIELDTTWLVAEWLTLRGSFGYTDAVYTDFKNGPCKRGEEGPCDLTGQTTLGVTPVNASLSAFSLFPISQSLAGNITFSSKYKSATFLSGDNDPRDKQPSYWLFDLSVGLGDFDGRWNLRGTVKNLFDKMYNISSGDGGLFNMRSATMGEPRRMLVELTVNFN